MVIASAHLPNSIAYETMSANGHCYNDQGQASSFMENNAGEGENRLHFHSWGLPDANQDLQTVNSVVLATHKSSEPIHGRPETLKQRRRRKRICKDNEEAEAQRITHIIVERNRRRIMNEHLAVLRSLMPDYCAQRGDQASIVGGAINFVKELEQLLQSLEAHKRILQQGRNSSEVGHDDNHKNSDDTHLAFPFGRFMRSQHLENAPAVANVEVTVIESHANLRILSKRRPKQLTKLITGIQALHLCILHLNVITLDQSVFYSINAKLEEGCQLKSVDDIASAVHHTLMFAAEEAGLS